MRIASNWRMAAVALLVLLMVGSTAAAAAPLGDKPAGPQSLPGDKLPPFNMLDERGRLKPMPHFEGPLHAAGGPPESAAEGPSLDAASQMALAAVHACARQGYRVGAAVVDSAGEARAMLTADGSDGSHVFVAMRKAITALAFGAPSSQVRGLIAAGKAPRAKVTPAMFVMGGAVPIFRQRRLIGAIGVSGAAGSPPGAKDETCAAVGLKTAPGR